MLHELPENHRLGKVYRYGGGFMALVLLTFGILGFTNQLEFFSTDGEEVAGLSSNGALSTISVVVGLILLAAALIGGNTSAWANTIFGALFLISGVANLALLRTDLNFLAFRMTNVIFSFVVGLLLLTFGFYGRVGDHLPDDNPYYQERHASATGPDGDRDEDRSGAEDRSRGTDRGRGGPALEPGQQATADVPAGLDDDPDDIPAGAAPSTVRAGGPIMEGAPEPPSRSGPQDS